jgi:hypothetical protein
MCQLGIAGGSNNQCYSIRGFNRTCGSWYFTPAHCLGQVCEEGDVCLQYSQASSLLC